MPLIPDEKLRLFLAGELASRKQRNPAYSLRAFARRLQMSPSFLSEVLKGKKAVSPSRAESLRMMLTSPDEVIGIGGTESVVIQPSASALASGE